MILSGLPLYPRFSFPWALLLLLVLLPWVVWTGSKIRSLSKKRRWTAVVLRVVIVSLLVAALAGVEMVRINRHIAVFFLLDHSNSIPEQMRAAATQWVRDACKKYMEKDDQAGVIVFGEDPSIELMAGPSLDLREIRSHVGGEQTDVAAAVRLARAAFPQGLMRRVVIISDGNETIGSAVEEARLARSAGVSLDVLPLVVGGSSEVRVREVSSPGQAKESEPFQLRIVVEAGQDCAAVLRLFQRTREGRIALPPRKVSLQKGDNVFLLNQELELPGFYEYEAVIESAADTVIENNVGRAFTIVAGEPTVLYVESDPTHSTHLKPALEAEGLRVEQIDPASLPASLAQLQSYDAIILSNVSATSLSMEHLKTIEALVRDLGVGLVMIGGPDSYGAGGLLDTPVEDALPVDMDIKQRKKLPRGALVLVMHTCEIPDGNAWAREIGLAALNVLSPEDLMGAIGYMWGQGNSGDRWIFGLMPVGDKQGMRYMLSQAASQIGDMPAVGPSLQLAYTALSKADAAVKRIIIISDGDPAAPTTELLAQIAAANISVSTICIAPHSPNDQNMLKWIATSTGGQYYFVTNPNNLPLIYTKEAAVVKRGLLVERSFVPVPFHESELMVGIPASGLPALKGYVLTTAKDNDTLDLVSDDGDPVLAHWRYGLGKSVAFTSDVTSRWAAEWLAWDGFNRFWAQTVRFAMRELVPADFRVDTRIKEGRGYVRIDAVDSSGRFINGLRPQGSVTGPGPGFKHGDLAIMQTGPGIYEASFPVSESGVYMLGLTYEREDGTRGMIPAGLALGYSREYEYSAMNRPLLENLALAGTGRVLAPDDDPFLKNLEPTPDITPVWHFFAMAAACLFPFEIFVRRVMISLDPVTRAVAVVARKVPSLGRLFPVREREEAVTGVYRTAERGEGSFGGGAPPPETAAGEPSAKVPAEAASAGPGQGSTDYTRRLLDAKKRAAEKTRRRSERDEDKET